MRLINLVLHGIFQQVSWYKRFHYDVGESDTLPVYDQRTSKGQVQNIIILGEVWGRSNEGSVSGLEAKPFQVAESLERELWKTGSPKQKINRSEAEEETNDTG